MGRKLCMGCMREYDERNRVCTNCGADNRGIPRDASQLRPGIYLKQGRYLVGLSLGSNKYNITYIGCDIKTGEKIVIKEYFPREYCSRQKESGQVKITDKQNYEAFQRGTKDFSRDGQDMIALRNPGMVRMRDVFTENGTVYQVMDYLEGNTLGEILNGQTFSMEDTLSVMLPVIETVCALHKQGILHLNIHPDNVFLLSTGEVILMDIGRWNCNLAKSGIEAEVNDYQAPELRIRDIQMEAGADIYSICAIMYQMLTGNTPLSSVERMQEDHMLSPKQQGAVINDSQDNIIMNGLEPDYLRRTSRMDIFYEQLTSVRMVERILPEVKKETPKPARAKRSTYAQESERSTSEKKSGGKNMFFFAIPCLVIVIAAVGIFAMKSKKSTPNTNVTVAKNDVKTAPNIEGANVEDVEKKGITLNITDAKEAKNGEKTGTIISQEPAAGEPLNQDNKSINVTVLSQEKISIQKVLDLGNVCKHEYSEQQKEKLAKEIKKQIACNVYPAEEESYVIPGYLIRIAAGTPDNNEELVENGEILKYKPITLVKSIGQQSEDGKGEATGRKAEDIIGETPKEIDTWAKESKFYYGISNKEKYSIAISKGEVVTVKVNGKSVKKKAPINKWDEVELVLSKGPKRVELSNNYWFGKTSTEVKKYLKGKHLKAEFTKNYSSTVPQGQIIGENSVYSPYDDDQISAKQKNKDGSRAKYYQGDTISFTVSLGEKPQPVTTQARPDTGGSGSSSGGSSSAGTRKKQSTSKQKSNGEIKKQRPKVGDGKNSMN